MSSEASVQGTSTNFTEMTPVVLESVLPHETQIEPQSSLPLTPRLPIEGEPSECKQEQAESMVTAGCTNGMAQLANPTETDTDVNRTALLGGEPAERVCRVDKGDGERESQSRIQQTYFYCKETGRGNEIANRNLPSALGLPLMGEWTVYPSSEMKSPNSGAGQEVEPVDVSNELETLVTLSIELEVPDNGEIPRVHLRGTSWWAGHANHLGD